MFNHDTIGSYRDPTGKYNRATAVAFAQGFDFVYRESSQSADCVLRNGRAEAEAKGKVSQVFQLKARLIRQVWWFPQECHVGGVEGAAMQPWLRIVKTQLVTKADVQIDSDRALWNFRATCRE